MGIVVSRPRLLRFDRWKWNFHRDAVIIINKAHTDKGIIPAPITTSKKTHSARKTSESTHGW